MPRVKFSDVNIVSNPAPNKKQQAGLVINMEGSSAEAQQGANSKEIEKVLVNKSCEC